MAPMIDMVFLLLVFFMTVSTLAKDSRPETGLPVSETAQVPSEVPPRDVLTVLSAGDINRHFWFNQEVSPESLLKRIQDRSEGHELLLRGAPDLKWKVWKDVLDRARKASVEEVVFSTFED